MIGNNKRWIAPLLALMFVFGMVGIGVAEINWNTTTVGLDVKTDITAVGATTGRTLNMTILGLDTLGNVDIYGESGGSTLIASVQTLIGTCTDGAGTTAAAAGSFAAVTRYITLAQGIGLVHIVYPNDVVGTDTISVVLFERRQDQVAGQFVTRQIATKTVSIDVVAATPTAGILNIEQFTKVASDTNGASVANAVMDATPTEAEDVGLTAGTGKMTANVAGGVFEIKAYKINGDRTYTADATASGSVTVTLTGSATAIEADGNNRASASTSYTCSGTMSQGVANVSVPTGFTAAGRYKVTATLGELSSVTHKISDNAATIDYIDIIPEATPASVGLACNMAVVSATTAANLAAGDANDDGITFDPTFTAKLLDQFGNKVLNAGLATYTIKVVDANSKVSDFNIVTTAGSNTKTSVQDGSSFSTGQASLTASVPANTLITASSAVSLKIVAPANQLAFSYTVADDADSDLNATTKKVGEDFQFVTTAIGVDANGDGDALDGTEMNALASTDTIRITNLKAKTDGTYESIDVAVTDNNPDTIRALFTVPATAAELQATGFKIQDTQQSYADCFVYPNLASALDFTVASPSKGYIKDAAGNIVSEVVATANANGTFTVTIDGRRISLKDAYGNANNSGNVSITTTKGTAGAAIAVGAAATITINYPVGTTGTDALSITFTQPGIASVNDGLGLTVTFPTVSTLASFDTFPAMADAATLSINAGMPLTLFPRTSAGATLTVADGYFVDYDTSGLNVYYDTNADGDVDAADIAAGAFVTGTNVGASTGRYPLLVVAKTVPGTYDLTIRSVDNLITKTVQVKVVEYEVPLLLDSSAVEIQAGSSANIAISGGSAPYSAASADETYVTATVDGSTLTVTGVAEGGPVDVTVTDANSATAVVAVTVIEATAIVDPPSGPGATELTGDDRANGVVTAGSVVTGGGQMGLVVNFPGYTAAVDIYVGIQLPDGVLYLVGSDGSLTTELVPYATGVTAAQSATIFNSFEVCTPFGASVPTGNWNVYSVVAPTNGGDLSAIDWDAGDYDLTYYGFEVTCP
jgi:hypothetical protein